MIRIHHQHGRAARESLFQRSTHDLFPSVVAGATPSGAPSQRLISVSGPWSRCSVGLMTSSSIVVRAGNVQHSRIACATSSGLTIAARSSVLGGRTRVSMIGVLTSPGRIVVARILLLRKVVCRYVIRLRTPAFAAPYGAPPSRLGRTAASDDTVTIVPPPAASMPGNTAWINT